MTTPRGSAETPVRIQLSRAKGWRMPANTVKVDRTTPWGNPFVPGKPSAYSGGRPVEDKRHAARLFGGAAPLNEKACAAAREHLRGKNVACWCGLCDLHKAGRPLGSNCPWCDPCHGDVWLEMANADPAPPDELRLGDGAEVRATKSDA